MWTKSRFGVALAMAACVCASACSGGSDKPAGGLTDSELVDTTPAGTKPVESVVWDLPAGEPTVIDPMTAGANSEMTVVANLCENLLTLNPDFSVGPGLARSAEWTDDTTFVLDLRDDVKFWDGTPMTADDVVYSLKRTGDLEGPSYYSGAFADVTSIEKTGPAQVTVRFRKSNAQFRNAIAGPTGNVVEETFATKAGEAFGTAEGGVMCTGPYQLVSWKPGDSIVTNANANYWNGVPKVEQITYEFMSDAATLTTALRSGEIDGAYDLPISTAIALAKGDSGTVYRGRSTQSIGFGPTTDKGPAADPRVREALDLAIDKQGLIASVLRGLGTTQKTFVSPLAWTGSAEADIYQKGYDALPANDTQDLERAKQLVEEAGATSTQLVMAVAAGGSTDSQVATVVQAAAKEIGIDIELRTLQPTEFSELFYVPGRRAGVDLVLTIGYQEVPGPLYYAPEFATAEGLYNWSAYNNPEVSTLLTGSRTTTDPVVSAEKFVEAQSLFATDRLQVTLAGLDTLLYLRKGLSGSPASVAYFSSPWALNLGGTD